LSCCLILRGGDAPEIVAKGAQPVDAQAEVDAGGAEINPLDQQLNNAGLLRWEKLRPERFEFNQGAADVILSDARVGFPGGPPGLDDDLGCLQQRPDLLNDNPLDFRGRDCRTEQALVPRFMTL
jgi:hypothetical protein